MNLRKSIIAALVLVYTLACQKETSFENGTASYSSQWEFKESGTLFKGKIDTAYFEDVFGIPSLVLDGSSNDLKGQLVIQLFGATSITTGTYKTPMVFFDYYMGGQTIYSNDITATDKFTLTITRLDSTSVSGTFSGEVLDTSKNIKNITDGKFTAYFKKSSSDPGTNTGSACKVNNIAYHDIATNTLEASLTSNFNGDQVNKIQMIDNANNNTVDNEFNLTYASSRINVDSKQYFVLQSDGKVKEFHGYIEPTDNTTPEVIITYTYDASGYMTKATVALASAPTVTAVTSTCTWTNGNLTNVTSVVTGTPEKTVIDYTYDATTTAKNFLSLFPSTELVVFQSAIDYGKSPSNLVKTITIKSYDMNGALSSTDLSTFANYTFTSSGQVSSFTLQGDASIYSTGVKYVLSYRCK